VTNLYSVLVIFNLALVLREFIALCLTFGKVQEYELAKVQFNFSLINSLDTGHVYVRLWNMFVFHLVSFGFIIIFLYFRKPNKA